jgi:hypothetical protein
MCIYPYPVPAGHSLLHGLVASLFYIVSYTLDPLDDSTSQFIRLLRLASIYMLSVLGIPCARRRRAP